MAEKAKAAVKKAPAKKSIAKGQAYSCGVCGLEVVVDEVCGCAEAHEIICCSKPMKEKTIRAKAAKK